MASPVDAVRERVELVLVAIAAVRDLPQDAAREPRFEIGAIGELERPGEADAAFGRRDVTSPPERRQFRGERGLEPARAGREKALGHRSSRRRVSTSAT